MAQPAPEPAPLQPVVYELVLCADCGSAASFALPARDPQGPVEVCIACHMWREVGQLVHRPRSLAATRLLARALAALLEAVRAFLPPNDDPELV